MSTDTDEAMSALFHRAMVEVNGDRRLVARAASAGRRRVRRRRAGLGAGVLAAGVAAVGVVAWVPEQQPPSAVADPSPSIAASPTRQPEPEPEPRVPTLDELAARVAEVAPAGSVERRRERREDGPLVEFAAGAGTLTAFAYDLAAMQGRRGADTDAVFRADELDELCRNQSRVSGCEKSAAGWTSWSVARPDVSGADRDARRVRVTHWTRDGYVVDLAVTNYTDIASVPAGAEPVFDKDELVRLAATGDWLVAD